MEKKGSRLIWIVSFFILTSIILIGFFLLRDRPNKSPFDGDTLFYGNKSDIICNSNQECNGVINCGTAEPACFQGLCYCLYTSSGGGGSGGGGAGGGGGGGGGYLVGKISNDSCTTSSECTLGIIDCGTGNPLCFQGLCSCVLYIPPVTNSSQPPTGNTTNPTNQTNQTINPPIPTNCSEAVNLFSIMDEVISSFPTYENQQTKDMVENQKQPARVTQMYRYQDYNLDVIIALMDSGETCFIADGAICSCLS